MPKWKFGEIVLFAVLVVVLLFTMTFAAIYHFRIASHVFGW